MMMDLLSGMEFDLFVPSFPELQTYFAVSSFWVEALLSINFIGYCFSLFFVGALADRYGRKPLLVAGLIIFIFGSMLCLWAPSYGSLLMGRFFQGAGVAAPSILSFLIIADNYPLAEQQRYMALLMGVMNIAVWVAPVLGSYITFYFHWQGNFVALLGLGLFVLMMTVLFIPNYTLSSAKAKPFLSSYVGILKSKPLMLLIGHIILTCLPYWIFVGMSPLLYMKALGVSLAHFGYYQGSLAIVFALGCFLISLVLNRITHKNWLRVANVIFFLSVLSLGLPTLINSTNPLLITLTLMPFIIGQIVPATILYPVCLNYKPEAKGQVSALIQAGRLVVCALTLQIAGFYYQGSFQSIGIIMLIIMSLAVVTLGMVIKNWDFYNLKTNKQHSAYNN
jgi:DHA1 family bicyclomycin/chloramphenicol resistance-like MFS transporter